MEVLAFTIDHQQFPNMPPMWLLNVGFRDGSRDKVLLREDVLRDFALRIADFQRAGLLPDLNTLNASRGQAARAEEFDTARRDLVGHQISGSAEDLIASQSRVFVQGGALTLAAATFSGRLFLAVFDPVSAHAILVAYSDGTQDE